MYSRITLAALLVALAMPTEQAAASDRWKIEVIGTFGGYGSESFGYGLNDLGQVVGAATLDGSPSPRAFLWSNGLLTDLGTLGGNHSWAYGINNAGTIVGSAHLNTGAEERGFIWNGTSMSEVTITGGTVTRVLAINSSGTMAGFGSAPVTSDLLAMRIHGGSADIVSSTSSQAYAINDSGRIAGFIVGISRASAAPFMSPGTTAETEIIGSLGTAYGINNHDQIVGQASIGGVIKAFLYSPDTPSVVSDFGFAGGPDSSAGNFSVAYDINDAGMAVGKGGAGLGHDSAVLYRDGQLINLTELADVQAAGWQKLEEARAINERGQIVGTGYYVNGERRAFLLTPIPEPTTFALFVAGLIGMLIYRQRMCSVSRSGLNWRKSRTDH